MLQQGNYNSSEQVITIDDLPALVPANPRVGDALADILTDLLGQSAGHSLQLPSLVGLAGFYNCTHMDVYDALRGLKARGYEYHLRGIDNPIRIWGILP